MKELVNSHPSIFRGLAASCLRVLSIAFTVALVTGSASAQMTGVTWEVDTVFYEPTTFDAAGEPLYADLEEYVTYKLFAEFTNPTDELSAIYSDAVVLGTARFTLMHRAAASIRNWTMCCSEVPKPGIFCFFLKWPTIPIGPSALRSESNTQVAMRLMDRLPCVRNKKTEGLIFTVVPEAAGDDLRIQFAQVTTCGSFEFHACFQVFVEGNRRLTMSGAWTGTAMAPHS